MARTPGIGGAGGGGGGGGGNDGFSGGGGVEGPTGTGAGDGGGGRKSLQKVTPNFCLIGSQAQAVLVHLRSAYHAQLNTMWWFGAANMKLSVQYRSQNIRACRAGFLVQPVPDLFSALLKLLTRWRPSLKLIVVAALEGRTHHNFRECSHPRPRQRCS